MLAEEGAREVAGYRVGLVLVFGLVGYESAGLVVVGQNDALFDGIKTDTELAARFRREPTGTESSDLPWKIDRRSLCCSSADLSVRACVSFTDETMLMAISIEGICIR